MERKNLFGTCLSCSSHIIAWWLCLGWSSIVHAQSWPAETSVGDFVYHADFALDELQPLLKHVAELESTIPRELKLPVVREPIHVFLFAQHQTYRQYVTAYFPRVPNRPALFIKRRGSAMVFARYSPHIDTDLRHEATHAILHRALPLVPLWLDEGIAEYYEVPDQLRGTHPYLKSIRSQVRWNKVPSLRKLEALESLEQMRPEHYRDAFAWVHFLLHGPPAANKTLVGYLRDIKHHTPPGSLARRLRAGMPRLERQYLDHFRTWSARRSVALKKTPPSNADGNEISTIRR